KKMHDDDDGEEHRDKKKHHEDDDKKHHAYDTNVIQSLVKKELEKYQHAQMLCTKVIGRISSNMFMDSAEELINKTLQARKISIEGKAYDTKIAILETLAEQSNKKGLTAIAYDS